MLTLGSGASTVPSRWLHHRQGGLKLSKPVLAALLCGLTTSAFASPLVYVLGNNDEGIGRLGTVDVSTGVFQQIGPNAPVGTEGLALGPNGSLFTVAFSGDLYSISP